MTRERSLGEIMNQTEDEFRRAVQEYATRRGWLVHHQRPAMTKRGVWVSAIEGDRGFPDCVFVRTGIEVVVEFKGYRGRLTADQKTWLSAYGACLPSSVTMGFRHITDDRYVAVWTPDDWPEIERVLR